jgi:hypothetical protein
VSRPALIDTIIAPSGAPIPSASVTLRQPGTATPIVGNIYDAGSGGSPVSQPLSADAYGRLQKYLAAAQTVDLYVTGAGFAAFTIPDYPIYPKPEDVISVDGVATLTNKTLSSPTVNTPTMTGGSWAGGALTGSPTIATPTITGATLAGKTTLPSNGAARVFEGLASAVGGAGWGSAGQAVNDPTHSAIVIGTTSPTLAQGKPAVLIEHHAKTEVLVADAFQPVDTLRVVRRSYDQGTLDGGYVTPGEEAVIQSIYLSYSTTAPSTAAGSGIENYSAHGYIQAGSRQGGFGFYTIQTLSSLNGLVFGAELDTTNLTGVAAPIWRQRPAGYQSATAELGHLIGHTALADGANPSTAGALINGGIAGAQWQDGIVVTGTALVAAGNVIDSSMTAASIVGLFTANGSVAVAYAKAENNTGTATSATSTTLTKTGAGWTASAFIGQWIRITGGTGSGQARAITANTTTQVTVSPAWTVTPDATSTFEISPNRNPMLGSGTDNSTRFYAPLYFDWRTDAATGSTLARLRGDTGMFGVGNVDPAARVHALGTGQASATPTTASGNQGASAFVVDGANAANNGGFLGLGATAASGNGIQVGIKAAAVNLANYGTADLVFIGRTAANIAADTMTEQMRISSAGVLTTRAAITAGAAVSATGALYPGTRASGTGATQAGVGKLAWPATSKAASALFPDAGGFGGTTMNGLLHIHNETDGAGFAVSVNGTTATVTMENGIAAPTGLTLSDSGATIRIFWSAGTLFIRNGFAVNKTISAWFEGTL